MGFIKKIIVWVLTLESRLILKKYRPFVIAVTGSVGKTSTKDAIYCVLKDHGSLPLGTRGGFVRKSEKSMNSEIGLPLTIIGVPNSWHSLSGWIRNIEAGLKLILKHGEYPDCLIVEIGADHPGDIKKVAKWLKTDITVITKISRTPVHVEFFKSPEQVFEEKASLVNSLKDGGVLVLFVDDEKVASIAGSIQGNGDNSSDINTKENLGVKKSIEAKNIRILTFGVDLAATARAVDYKCSVENGISFTLDLVGEKSPVNVSGIVGKAYLYSLLAAAAVAKSRDLPIQAITKVLNTYEAPRGRLNIILGMNGSTLIDDTYNSSPDAVLAALETLKGLECYAGRKIAILGDMMELGKYSSEQHRQIGKEVISCADILITVGLRSKTTAEEALKSGLLAGNVYSFEDSSAAAIFAVSIAKAGDIILVKGSQSMRMERVVKALLREPEKAARLLVRQEQEWLEKK
ncbi:MAG: UDP-N-acetylmuramoyl-tripeptide--D-alanyl-D-alanine ligase [Candidatus Taylorbacteria bacterium]|nr:UDP-N-acetylmuramoyl-tripeptide--D-alanyl-D-alanine ligase [Candidatus Taylorbacteria bacterium]